VDVSHKGKNFKSHKSLNVQAGSIPGDVIIILFHTLIKKRTCGRSFLCTHLSACLLICLSTRPNI